MDAIETIRNGMSAKPMIGSIARLPSGSCNDAIGPFGVFTQRIDLAAPPRPHEHHRLDAS